MNSRLLLLVGLCAGCAELDPYLPKVKFEELRVNDIDFEKADVDFVFNVENPNPLEISLSSFSYALGFEQIELLSGDNEDGFTLEASAGSELDLPVSVTWENAWNTVQATRGEDVVDFGLDGHFGFDTPIGEARIPYSEAGDFPAVRTPKFSFETVRVASFDPIGMTASVEVDLGVDNEHASSLFFEAFDYNLSLGGNQVASGLIGDLGEIEGATNGTLVLPVDIDLLGVGTTVYEARAGNGNVAIGLDAGMDVDTPFGLLPLSIDETGNVSVESD